MFSIGLKTLKDKIFWAFILIFSALRLLVCYSMPLSRDELYFASYTKFISFFYLDHPPLIAYILKFFVVVFGNNNLTPRICSSVMFIAMLYLLYCFIKKVFNSTIISQISVLLICATPILNKLECNTDLPFLIFFILAIYFFYYLIETKNDKYLLLLSMSMFLGLLAKYTMLCIYPSFFLFLILSKEDRYILKQSKFYIALFLPLIISFIMLLVCNFSVKYSIHYVKCDVLGFFRLYSHDDIRRWDVILQFLGSQLVYTNYILTFIHNNVLLDIVFEYVHFVKYYGYIFLALIIAMFYHIFYLYKKAHKKEFLYVFCFSIVILFLSFAWSCILFPIEYCAMPSLIMLSIYIGYIFSKNKLLRICLYCFILFGLYCATINPKYILYGLDSLSPNKIYTAIKHRYNVQDENMMKMINSIPDDIKAQTDFIAPIGGFETMNFYIYYLPKEYRFVFLFQYDGNYRYWDQNIKDVDSKNCVLIFNTDIQSPEGVEECLEIDTFINKLRTNNVFDNIEELTPQKVYFCKKFNLKKYIELYSGYHFELKK